MRSSQLGPLTRRPINMIVFAFLVVADAVVGLAQPAKQGILPDQTNQTNQTDRTDYTKRAKPPSAVVFQSSIEEARRKGGPNANLVVVFSASWCGYCRKLENATLTDESVQKTAGDILWVKIDFDKEPELAARFGVQGVPHVVLLDKDNRSIGANSGYLPPEPFAAWLRQTINNPQPEPYSADQLLAQWKTAKDASGRGRRLRGLIEVLAQPDRAARQRILKSLKEMAAEDRGVLLDMMSDERLAVRAAAAFVLGRVLTDVLKQSSPPYHPFADVQKRQSELEAWRKILK